MEFLHPNTFVESKLMLQFDPRVQNLVSELRTQQTMTYLTCFYQIILTVKMKRNQSLGWIQIQGLGSTQNLVIC